MAIPTDIVLGMRSQNLSNSQIIQSLQRNGYTSQQIADAMAQADIKYNVEQVPSGEPQQGYEEPQYPSYNQPAEGGEMPIAMESLQAMVEAVIEEKWQDLIKNVSRIADWKDKTDIRLAAMEQQIAELKNSFDKLHSAILEKIGDYDKTMTDVSTDLKAMERVFSKILPGFIENVSALSSITDDLKGLKKTK